MSLHVRTPALLGLARARARHDRPRDASCQWPTIAASRPKAEVTGGPQPSKWSATSAPGLQRAMERSNTSRPPKRAWRSWQGSTSFSDSGYCRRSWSLCSTSEPRSTSTSTAERAVRLSALIWPRAPLCMEAAAATHLARSIALPAAPDHGLPGHDHHHECKRKDQRVVGDRVSHVHGVVTE